MIVAKNCYFWTVFPQILCGRYPPNSSNFPKPHFLLTCTYLRGRRHGRNLPMAKATDGLAFGITRGFKGLRLTAGRRPKGGYVGPTCGSLGQVGPMFAYVSRRLPQVGPMLALCSLMIAHVGPMLALCWPKLALSCPYVGPILALCCPIVSTNLPELC